MSHEPRRSTMLSTFSVLTLLALWGSVMATEAPRPDLDGRWKATIQRDDGPRSIHLDLYRGEKGWRGAVTSERFGRTAIHSSQWTEEHLDLGFERETDRGKMEFRIRVRPVNRDRLDAVLSFPGRDFSLEMRFDRLGDPRGQWKVEAGSPDGADTYPSTYTIWRDGEGYRGRIESEERQIELEGIRWDGDRLSTRFPLPLGEATPTIALDLGFDDAGALAGTWSAVDTDYSGSWKGQRVPVTSLRGTWKVELSTDEGEYEHDFIVEGEAGAYRAKYRGELGEAPYQTVRVDGPVVHLAIEVEIEGEPVGFTVRALRRGDTVLDGRWQARDFPDRQGRWKATRPEPLPGPPPAVAADFLGKWELETVDPDGNRIEFGASFREDDGRLGATVHFDNRDLPARDLHLGESGVRFHFSLPLEEQELRIEILARVQAGKISGAWKVPSENQSGSFEGSRPAAPKPRVEEF